MRGRGINVKQLAAVAGFSFSCFVLLLYLWLRSGGAIPLAAEKYRVHVLLPQSKGLGPHSDVRVSGVTVGHVIYVKPATSAALGRADVMIDLDRPYVPLRSDARAMLRTKSIMGEAYVALSLGSRNAPPLEEGGTLAASRAANAVESDQIFGSYDARTRKALQQWMRSQAPPLAAHGQDLNAAVGSLRPWMVDADRLLATVQGQGADVAALLRDGGSVAQSLADREQALQLLARSGDRAFNAVGDQGTALAAAFRQLPGFQREATRTLNELTRFANQRTADVAAVRRELAPLSPAVQALAADAPALRTVVESTPRLARAAKSGLPALDRVLGDAPPLFEQLDPFLRSLNPALRYLASTRTELTGLIANLAAATQSATATPKSKEPVHYLRAMPVLNPAALGPLSQRPGANRANPYPNGTTLDLLNGYTSWTSSNCGRPTPYITDDPSPYLTEEQRTEIHDYAFGGKPDDPPAPACKAQAAGAAAGGSGIPGLFPLLPADR